MSVSNILVPNPYIINCNGLNIANVNITNDSSSGTITNGQLLHSVVGVYCKIESSSTQTITANTFSAVTLSTAQLDNASFFNVSTPTYVTIPQTGIYEITGTVSYYYNLTGTISLQLRQNSGVMDSFTYSNYFTNSTVGINASITGRTIQSCTAGDEISIWTTTSASGQNLNGGFLIVKKIGTA